MRNHAALYMIVFFLFLNSPGSPSLPAPSKSSDFKFPETKLNKTESQI